MTTAATAPTRSPAPQTMLISPRILRLRDELFSAGESICFERARIVTQSYRATEGQHPALRHARALAAVFAQMPIFIREGELLVGQRASRLAAAAIYPEYRLDGLTREGTPPEIWDYWRGRTLADEVRRMLPESLRLAESEKACGEVTGTNSGFGHVVVDYPKAINRGFRSIIAEARQRLDEAPRDDAEGRAFLEAVAIAGEGIIHWASRYADLAESQANTERDPARAAELRHIATICRRVPAESARTFHEALQSFWFVHLAMHIEQYGWSISAGRFDQYMYPFFRAGQKGVRSLFSDTEQPQGRSAQKASDPFSPWELLLNLWVKFMENVAHRVKLTIFQNMTLGGQDEHGRDQSNELSHLCLDATARLGFNQPALSVRWHPNIDPGFWSHAHRTIGLGLGLPALFNDQVIIPALVKHGVAPADAVGYALVGCVEASVAGKQQGLTAGGHLNIAKALELALNDGRSMITGRQIGPATGVPEEFGGFDDLWRAYVQQTEYLASLNVLASVLAGEGQKRYGHCPLMSSLLDDCVERRRDLVFGGTRYNLAGTCIFGNANVYDGLTAIKRLVCEEKRLSWAELHRALLDDFAGHEPIRQLLRNNADRFGNDQPEVDDLANRVNAVHADFFWRHTDGRNGRFTCGVWPVEGHVYSGQWTAATPDGRHKGAPLVDGVGACHGADRNGPTALLKSVARLNNVDHWPAGNTCNIRFSQSIASSPVNLRRLESLTSTFMRLGGQELQINVIDAATLRAAQADPEAHADLLVRVAGFSAYFTTLGKATQDEIISRTEHA